MDVSPSRTLLRSDVPPPWAPSCRRIGRALCERVSTHIPWMKERVNYVDRGLHDLPLEEIEIGIETPSDSLEEENADDHVDEVPFHAHVVAANHAQDFAQDVADLDVA